MYPEYKTSLKDDLVIGVPIVVIVLVLIYSVLWLIAGFKAEQHCINFQRVIEVQAAGHKYGTSYYVRGENGGVTETHDITQVGAYICFDYGIRNYYQLSPWITWWK